MHRELKIALASFCAICIITGIVLFAISFSVVELGEWGLVYDTFHQQLDTTPYSSTRSMIGIANSFLIFPRTAVNIEFSKEPSAQSRTIEAWTSDGLNIYLDVSFQILLKPTRLREIYLEYGPDWYAAVVRLMYSRIKETSVNFKTTDYFEKREEIAQKLTDVFKQTFKEDFGDMIDLYDLQLTDINFETAFENVIVEKLNEAQYIETAKIKQNVAMINKDIQYIQAQANNQIRNETAKASSNGLIATQTAEADAFFTLFNQTSMAYKDILGVSPPSSDILQMIYASELPYMDANNVYVNPGNIIIKSS